MNANDVKWNELMILRIGNPSLFGIFWWNNAKQGGLSEESIEEEHQEQVLVYNDDDDVCICDELCIRYVFDEFLMR